MYIVSWIQNKIWTYSRSIVNQTHRSSVIIIITITAYHCSLFNVYQTVSACYCAETAGCSHYRWGLYFSPINMLFPFPLELFPFPFQLVSRKLLPFPWESHGNPVGMGIPIPMHTFTSEYVVAAVNTGWDEDVYQSTKGKVNVKVFPHSQVKCRARDWSPLCSSQPADDISQKPAGRCHYFPIIFQSWFLILGFRHEYVFAYKVLNAFIVLLCILFYLVGLTILCRIFSLMCLYSYYYRVILMFDVLNDMLIALVALCHL